jgi:FdhD protein
MAINIHEVKITKFINGDSHEILDAVAVEQPLEITIAYWHKEQLIFKIISITMRTPGHDEELALGFLYSEHIISSTTKIEKIEKKGEHKICIFIKGDFALDLQKTERNFYTTSSCGVCGKASIEAVLQKNTNTLYPCTIKVSISTLLILKDKITKHQSAFQETGGIHAATLFDTEGQFLAIFEDVGRHNALDKLIGFYYKQGRFYLNNEILVLSGRASFELIQKASMAQIPIICAIGAPSSLALELACEMDITLLGFLKKDRANIYCGTERINF